MRYFAFLALLPALAQAAESPAARAPLSAASVGQMLAALLLVILAAFASLWLLKRFQLTATGGQGLMRVLASLPLGTRDRLVLVEVGKEQLLISLSTNGIRCLHVLAEPLSVPAAEAMPGQFQRRLLDALAKSRAATGTDGQA